MHVIVYTFHCRVVESKNAEYSVGDLVVGRFGWTTHSISSGAKSGDDTTSQVMKLDPAVHSSPSTALGVLGMPG